MTEWTIEDEANKQNEIQVLNWLDALTMEGECWLSAIPASDKEFLTMIDHSIESEAEWGKAGITIGDYNKVEKLFHQYAEVKNG